MHDLLALTPDQFVAFLRSSGIGRFHLVADGDRVTSSHDVLAPLARFLENERRDFMGHEGLFFQAGSSGVLQGAFVHKTVRGQAAGGVRYWSYATVEDYLRDGLRLSAGMTRKNALAGLWWGGGKGVMATSRAATDRAAVYREYGDLMTALRGCYVTAEDVGTRVADMAQVFSRTRFTTCIPAELGGSGNPSIPTARGVVVGIEAALAAIGAGSLAGKTVAVQGLGNVGEALAGLLCERGARVIGVDVRAAAVERVRAQHPAVEALVAAAGDDTILGVACDVLAPCATGAILNARSIARLSARIVCGAANNQLEDPVTDDRRLVERGITYVPDFLVNRMGIVTCADEQAGHVAADSLIERHLDRAHPHGIWQTTLRVLAEAASQSKPPGVVATALADDLANQPHPLFGHRGLAIIGSLVANRWWQAVGNGGDEGP